MKKTKELVKKSVDFNYQNIERIDNDEIYSHLDAVNTLSHFGTNRQKIMNLPISKHGFITQELGKMKKYPRERVSQSILAISGKFDIKNKTKNLSHDFNIKHILKGKIELEDK